MASKENRVEIPHSFDPSQEELPPVVRKPDSQEEIEATVLVRWGRTGRDLLSVEEVSRTKPNERQRVAPEAFHADPEDLVQVEEFARENGLTVVESSQARRAVRLRGPVGSFQKAFDADLRYFTHDEGEYLGLAAPLSVPAKVGPVVQGVMGLDRRPVARWRSWMDPTFTQVEDITQPEGRCFTPPEIADLYDFPAKFDGQGQCIALIQAGGGCSGGYSVADLKQYLGSLGIDRPPWACFVPVGDVIAVPPPEEPPCKNTDEAKIRAWMEVALDIQVVSSVAPGAKIVVYFTDEGYDPFYNAIQTALQDEANKPSVISTSWGFRDDDYFHSPHWNSLFEEAVHRGITVLASSGDDGTLTFPALNRWVLGCGGTTVHAADGEIQREEAWKVKRGDKTGTSGKGFNHDSLPEYQLTGPHHGARGIMAPGGRGVPDVAGCAGPYRWRIFGQDRKDPHTGAQGTSAVAPLWAGLIARINQALGCNVGFINHYLYQFGDLQDKKLADAIQPIIPGDSRQSQPDSAQGEPYWDTRTGLGRPNGENLLDGLRHL